MRAYNTKNFLKILVSLHKTDTLKILFPTILLVGIYCYGVYYLEVEYLHLNSLSSILRGSLQKCQRHKKS